MMRGHCEYEPIRDIIEKPSFEKGKCKKHLVRQVKVTVNKSGQDFQNFVFPLFSEKKQLISQKNMRDVAERKFRRTCTEERTVS